MRPPSGVNLTALDSRFSRICFSLRSSATISPSAGSTSQVERDAVALRALANQRHRIGDRRRQVESRELELHPPGLDLRQVEDVVDQREQMPSRMSGCPSGSRPASR